MNLSYTEHSYRVVNYEDIDALIEAEYGHAYNSVAAMEWSNDTYYPMEVTGTHFSIERSQEGRVHQECYLPGLTEYDQQTADDFRAGKEVMSMYGEMGHTPALDILLEDLCVRNVIEPGAYLIRVSW